MSRELKLEPRVRDALKNLGVDVDELAARSEGARVVVIQATMEEAVDALGRCARDQVVMTRIDTATAEALDCWVDAGIAKSRSEAAALFLQEGLKLRQPELSRMHGAIETLRNARKDLEEQAQRVMGKSSKRTKGS